MKKSQIYTKTGDKGTTALVGGTRVPKAHIRLEAYGTIDELNSFVGFLACQIEEDRDKAFLLYIQHRLFTIGSYLATETESMPPKAASIIAERDIDKIEAEMDFIDSSLPKINRFILPGGNEAAGRANLCRTVCRRAERSIYRVKEVYPVDELLMKFVNRLSDYFFLLGRKECNKTNEEIFWDQTI